VNQPRFEVFPEKVARPRFSENDPAYRDDEVGALTGQFVWHFKDANGKLTHIGGQPFTRREDAHRAICGVVADALSLAMGFEIPTENVNPERIPIVDLDEDGKLLAMTTAYERSVSDLMRAKAGV
jgi:hypothetical protein